jgi:DNA polymerase-1
MKRLVLIDGHAILHRAYFAFPKTLKTRRGELVNAVYGFSRILLSVLEKLHPEYVAVAFDLPEPTFRHKEYLGYQIQRPKMDEELKGQIERVNEVIQALNIPIFAVSGFEADDVIGTLARQAVKKKTEAVIITGDKDMMQLVNQMVKIYAPQKGLAEGELFDRQKVKKELGVFPEQVVDYKGLTGDASDNYPGVPGIGPKTATQLLQKFGNLDKIYREIKKIENKKLRERLTQGKESAALSKKLAKIVTNVPIGLDLKACRVHDYDRQKAVGLFAELGFKSLIDKLPGVEKPQKPKNKLEQKRLF